MLMRMLVAVEFGDLTELGPHMQLETPISGKMAKGDVVEVAADLAPQLIEAGWAEPVGDGGKP